MFPAWAQGTPQPGGGTPDCPPTQGVGGSPQQEEGPQAFLPTLGSHRGVYGEPRGQEERPHARLPTWGSEAPSGLLM